MVARRKAIKNDLFAGEIREVKVESLGVPYAGWSRL